MGAAGDDGGWPGGAEVEAGQRERGGDRVPQGLCRWPAGGGDAEAVDCAERDREPGGGGGGGVQARKAAEGEQREQQQAGGGEEEAAPAGTWDDVARRRRLVVVGWAEGRQAP
jgi:hypothetical protein